MVLDQILLTRRDDLTREAIREALHAVLQAAVDHLQATDHHGLGVLDPVECPHLVEATQCRLMIPMAHRAANMTIQEAR